MLVAAGQPVEVVRSFRDIDGAPIDPAPTPTAEASQNGGAPTACDVRSLVDAGLFGARVPAAMLSALGTVEIAWSWEYETDTYSAVDLVDVTTVPVCTIADVDALPASDTRVPVAGRLMLQAISIATAQFEAAVNDTFSPRQATEVVVARYPKVLAPRPTQVVAVVRDGVPIADLSGVTVDGDTGVIYGLPATYLPVPWEVTVRYGMDRPPEDVTRAVAVLASAVAVAGPWDDRGYAVGDDAGTVRLLTAGVGRARFSIPEVEATARRYRIPVVA